MNKSILMGRLTRDPEVRYAQNDDQMAIARYTLAVDRRTSRNAEDAQTADFINCVAFGRSAEFAEKYFRKGTKIVVEGHIQTGSFTNKDGQRVYTTDVVIDNQEFAESKSSSQERDAYYDEMAAGQGRSSQQQAPTDSEGFMNIPDGIDEELPFG